MDGGEEEKRSGRRKEKGRREDIAKTKKGYRNGGGEDKEEIRKSRGRKKRDELKEKKLKICFWNVADVMNKEDTWRYLEEFDLIGLTETWLEEEKWEKMKDKMSKEFG